MENGSIPTRSTIAWSRGSLFCPLSQGFPVKNLAYAKGRVRGVYVMTGYLSPERVRHVNSGAALTCPAIAMI